MRSFLIRFGVFAVMVLATLMAGEIYVRQYPNPARDKHMWMLTHSEDVRTLVLGSSHTFYGVKPNLLGPHAYSLAMVSQTYRYDLYLLQHYPMPQLATVVLPFSYFSLFDDFETMPDEPFTATRYRIYMDCDIHPWLSFWNLECMQGTAFKEKIRSLWTPAQTTWDSLGYGTNYRLASRPTDWDNGVERAHTNNRMQDGCIPSSVALNRQYLESIMDYCQRRGIRLILLSTPCMPSFVSHRNPAQVALNESILRELLAVHPEVVRLDWEQDYTFRKMEENYPDFYDADHLSDVGATQLSLRLRPYIR